MDTTPGRIDGRPPEILQPIAAQRCYTRMKQHRPRIERCLYSRRISPGHESVLVSSLGCAAVDCATIVNAEREDNGINSRFRFSFDKLTVEESGRANITAQFCIGFRGTFAAEATYLALRLFRAIP